MLLRQSESPLFIATLTYRVLGATWLLCKAADIQQYCAENGITPNSFFCGVYARAFAQVTEMGQTLFLTAYDGRMLSKYKRTVGCLASTVPLFVDASALSLEGPAYFEHMQSLLRTGYAYSIFSHDTILQMNGVDAAVTSFYYYDHPRMCTADAEFDLSEKLAETMDPLCMKVHVGEYVLVELNVGYDLGENLVEDLLARFAALVGESLHSNDSA